MTIKTVEEKRTVTNFHDGDFEIKLSDLMGLCARLFVGAIVYIHDSATYEYFTEHDLIETISGHSGEWMCKKGGRLKEFFLVLVSKCSELELENTLLA